MDEMRNTLFERLRKEHRLRTWRRPLIYLACFMAISSLATLAAALSVPDVSSFNVCCLAAAIFSIPGFAFFAYLLIFRRPAQSDTARNIDRECHGMSRMETALEMLSSGNPLREAQMNEARSFYSGQKPVAGAFMLLLLAALILLMTGAQAGLLERQYSKTGKAIAAEKKNASDAAAEPEKKAPDYAELALIAPDSEIRAKPIDEIIWEGSARTSCGFKSLGLEVSVNGATPCALAIENPPLKKTGENSMSGELLLENLKVVPFDVISYNLCGLAPVNSGGDAEIVSVPQFIEVRPFREDAVFMKSLPGQKKLDMLVRFLRIQLALNKATFAARVSGLAPDNPVVREQLGIIAAEQRDLRVELDKFLEETPAEEMSSNVFDNLKKSMAAMDDACRRIGNLPDSGNPKGKAVIP